MHLGRGTFAIIIVLILAAIGGSFIGGRLSAQELLTIFGIFLLWAFGVSIWRGYRRIKNGLRRPPDSGSE